jgi:AcrR family transcriptional regulator
MQGTADRIQAAALAVFVANGYSATSMAQIRERAGVSNGSLFHFFPRKVDLAAGVLTDGMRDCQEAVLTALDATTGAVGVRAGVHALLDWVSGQAEMARFVFADAPDEVLLAAEPVFGAHNRRYVHDVAAWLAARDLLRGRPFEVVHALWFGPSMELGRTWLRGRSRIAPTAAAEELAAAAWRAVNGR